MTLPRSVLINADLSTYYHCTSRCVRRAFLCGKDVLTGRDFEHRRAWIVSRLSFLSEVFAIDVCAYAVMSNHYHVVLHLNTEQQLGWSDEQVVDHWKKIHHIPKWFNKGDADRDRSCIASWRERLGSISWLMREVNEPLARLSNKEDNCKGRFWEGRFASQALLDDSGLLKCMAYVDLNPVRAGIAETPESSDYTSVQARIKQRDDRLAPMADAQVSGFTLPISKKEYLILVDWTGRTIRDNKRGQIQAKLPPIIARLQDTCGRDWLDEIRNLSRHYFRAIGNVVSMREYRDRLGLVWLRGLPT